VGIVSYDIQEDLIGIKTGNVCVEGESDGIQSSFGLLTFLECFEPVIRRTIWERLSD